MTSSESTYPTRQPSLTQSYCLLSLHTIFSLRFSYDDPEKVARTKMVVAMAMDEALLMAAKSNN